MDGARQHQIDEVHEEAQTGGARERVKQQKFEIKDEQARSK